MEFTSGSTLLEINLYPYLTWAFYGTLLFFSPFFMRKGKRLYTLFLITLIFETAFVIDIGFFVRPSYVIGLILTIRTMARGLMFPWRYALLLTLFVLTGIASIFLNLGLIGAATSGESRATFIRPLIQSSQLIAMIFITITTFTILKKGQYFRHTIRVLHWLSVAVALAALYELAAIYFHLPYLNLNNMVPHYWYPGFGTTFGYIFRARVTFIEPIELNNFQLLGIMSSLVYRILYKVPWRRYWPLLILQLLVLFGTFSRSTILTVSVLTPLFLLLYPRRVKTALGFFADRWIRVLTVGAIILLIVYAGTMTPDEVKQSSLVSQAVLTRLILHKNKYDEIKPWGRARAGDEIQPLVEDRRLAFGVGLGNDANWKGGIGGSYNIYNQIILYTGVIGLGIFFIFISSIMHGLFRNYLRRSTDLDFRKINWIVMLGFTGMLVQRLSFSGLLNDTYLWVAFGLCIYLGYAKGDILQRGDYTEDAI
ncbi:hypothetical protein A3B21_00155 [Candidatus Uhrbacteria bacterium RIFCSPLOWO2_01_FULL_47_24]|uniref:Uncharacterized protein n=1 Tax=Candidatus Uhrbacteria bacterium RIFCSPLOWO2_01_FULL_47_24 TaxID=1802401 RepID=A0A1F7USP1_9BACT|nr:MAG: hypothetical protein A2753_02255 [Candidatus Uhrbacteria bacterium RIFCSPHIGHO2_01_FULL_47_11]OGL68009.1 MAG: hypothetical protein A3D58_01530 [Candidatus Uhrbacteria bacterium RIFCSPHIGHO2_02_FULL_46_47]OGL81323.1 MAG: hypothetical protein A3B21_00155 [Candidatus Uhrbacteria bacterium RIFCSPLOWO2_01_FULL_47_24]OGL83933.1 MAG: hypothetical protein A3J03_00750 [Candidatus Uhrbacteria bacterium RIFCSPLOWO2_02_FULL_46_25]OGL91609.1 MAG: hypothetical protein A3H11_04840 [Candidatus Uhrbacte